MPRAPGLQKVGKNKTVGLGTRPCQIIQTNFYHQSWKDKKLQKGLPMLWLPLPPLYIKSGGEFVNAASVKRTLAMSSQFSSWKVPNRHPRACFCGRMKKQTPPEPHSGTFNGSQGIKTICQPSYSPNTVMADIFLFQRGKVEAGRPLSVSGQPHDEVVGGRLNQQQKWVRPRLFMVDGLPRTLHPNWFWGGLKMSCNSQVSNMFYIKVILPCAFDSEHTS